jgi:hypothetical protein
MLESDFMTSSPISQNRLYFVRCVVIVLLSCWFLKNLVTSQQAVIPTPTLASKLGQPPRMPLRPRHSFKEGIIHMIILPVSPLYHD